MVGLQTGLLTLTSMFVPIMHYERRWHASWKGLWKWNMQRRATDWFWSEGQSICTLIPNKQYKLDSVGNIKYFPSYSSAKLKAVLWRVSIYIYYSSILDPGYGISYSLPDQHSASDPAEPAVPPVASTVFFSCSRFAPRLTKNRRHIHTGVATLEGEKETRASNFVASCPLQSHPSSRRRRRHGWPILPDPWRHHPLST